LRSTRQEKNDQANCADHRAPLHSALHPRDQPFFLWAFGVNLNDILIPHLKKAFRLSDFRSSLIQTAFFGGYFLAALPAGWLMEKIGYRRGILVGLLTCAAGALMFIPAPR
jgi:FHS family L-fucose permease-like MFS transporter